MAIFPEIKSIAKAIPQTVIRHTQARQPSQNATAIPIVSFPGIGSPESFLAPLLRHLQDAGHNVRLGGHKINLGPTYRMYDRLEKLLHHVAQSAGTPVIGIGHSLGALYHLHFAHLYPELYSHIIGLAGPCELTLAEAHTHTNIGAAFTVIDHLKPFYRQDLLKAWKRESERPPLPEHIQCSMIIAAKDGTVSPFSCELPDHPNYRNYYVDATHGGLLDDPVTHALTEHLAMHGNQVPLPPEIERLLLTREEVSLFQKRPSTTPGDVARGTINFIRSAIQR